MSAQSKVCKKGMSKLAQANKLKVPKLARSIAEVNDGSEATLEEASIQKKAIKVQKSKCANDDESCKKECEQECLELTKDQDLYDDNDVLESEPILKKRKNSSKIGTKQQVWDGEKEKTRGGLKKEDLCLNKKGKIVSKKQSERGKAQAEKFGFKKKQQ